MTWNILWNTLRNILWNTRLNGPLGRGNKKLQIKYIVCIFYLGLCYNAALFPPLSLIPSCSFLFSPTGRCRQPFFLYLPTYRQSEKIKIAIDSDLFFGKISIAIVIYRSCLLQQW